MLFMYADNFSTHINLPINNKTDMKPSDFIMCVVLFVYPFVPILCSVLLKYFVISDATIVSHIQLSFTVWILLSLYFISQYNNIKIHLTITMIFPFILLIIMIGMYMILHICCTNHKYIMSYLIHILLVLSLLLITLFCDNTISSIVVITVLLLTYMSSIMIINLSSLDANIIIIISHIFTTLIFLLGYILIISNLMNDTPLNAAKLFSIICLYIGICISIGLIYFLTETHLGDQYMLLIIQYILISVSTIIYNTYIIMLYEELIINQDQEWQQDMQITVNEMQNKISNMYNQIYDNFYKYINSSITTGSSYHNKLYNKRAELNNTIIEKDGVFIYDRASGRSDDFWKSLDDIIIKVQDTTKISMEDAHTITLDSLISEIESNYIDTNEIDISDLKDAQELQNVHNININSMTNNGRLTMETMITNHKLINTLYEDRMMPNNRITSVFPFLQHMWMKSYFKRNDYKDLTYDNSGNNHIELILNNISIISSINDGSINLSIDSHNHNIFSYNWQNNFISFNFINDNFETSVLSRIMKYSNVYADNIFSVQILSSYNNMNSDISTSLDKIKFEVIISSYGNEYILEIIGGLIYKVHHIYKLVPLETLVHDTYENQLFNNLNINIPLTLEFVKNNITRWKLSRTDSIFTQEILQRSSSALNHIFQPVDIHIKPFASQDNYIDGIHMKYSINSNTYVYNKNYDNKTWLSGIYNNTSMENIVAIIDNNIITNATYNQDDPYNRPME